MKKLMHTWLATLLLLVASPSLRAQTNSVQSMPKNRFLESGFDAYHSLFYYSDVGVQQWVEGTESGCADANSDSPLCQAVLLAATATANGSMMFSTEVPVYVVLSQGVAYISQNIDDLTNLNGNFSLPGDSKFNISSPNAGPNANISMFMVAVQKNSNTDQYMYVDGIGTVILQDIDPSTKNSVLVPENSIFSIQTLSETNCYSNGDHMLQITW